MIIESKITPLTISVKQPTVSIYGNLCSCATVAVTLGMGYFGDFATSRVWEPDKDMVLTAENIKLNGNVLIQTKDGDMKPLVGKTI